VQFAGFYVADTVGYYRARGLTVTLNPGLEHGHAMPAIQSVASGLDDFGVSGPESIILARSKGIRIKAIATLFQHSPFCYIGLKSQNITKLRDLLGQPIGVNFDNTDVLT